MLKRLGKAIFKVIDVILFLITAILSFGSLVSAIARHSPFAPYIYILQILGISIPPSFFPIIFAAVSAFFIIRSILFIHSIYKERKNMQKEMENMENNKKNKYDYDTIVYNQDKNEPNKYIEEIEFYSQIIEKQIKEINDPTLEKHFIDSKTTLQAVLNELKTEDLEHLDKLENGELKEGITNMLRSFRNSVSKSISKEKIKEKITGILRFFKNSISKDTSKEKIIVKKDHITQYIANSKICTEFYNNWKLKTLLSKIKSYSEEIQNQIQEIDDISLKNNFLKRKDQLQKILQKFQYQGMAAKIYNSLKKFDASMQTHMRKNKPLTAKIKLYNDQVEEVILIDNINTLRTDIENHQDSQYNEKFKNNEDFKKARNRLNTILNKITENPTLASYNQLNTFSTNLQKIQGSSKNILDEYKKQINLLDPDKKQNNIGNPLEKKSVTTIDLNLNPNSTSNLENNNKPFLK